MPDVNITIIGAGVVGLAIAAKLSKNHKDVFVLEKHSKFGQETSSRNSEVIHSGIYYPTNSLKAKLCVKGNKMLYDYCIKNDVLNNKCGKLIVATTNDEAKELSGILKQSQINGVEDGSLISQEQIYELEPHISAVAALYYPSTGIIDTHGLMKQLETDSIINGVQMAYKSDVINIQKKKEEGIYHIEVGEANDSYNFTTKYVINTAGLHADKISKMLGIVNENYDLHYWKGEYFGIGNGKNKLINHLIYPTPNKNITGLGVHVTIDINGGVKLGPNAIYLPDNIIDYSIDPEHKNDFFLSASKYLPFLEQKDLHPDQSGIRPKLHKPGGLAKDFIISEETKNGFPNFINLIGIESPGLTASLAIAEEVNSFVFSMP